MEDSKRNPENCGETDIRQKDAVECADKKRNSLREEMKNHSVLCFAAGVLFAVVVMAAAWTVYLYLPFTFSPSKPDSLSAFRKTKQIQRIIERNYLNEIDEQRQTDTMYLGQVAGLGDKYANYYTKEEYEKIRMSNNGQMEGIGIVISQEESTGRILITDVYEGSPADKAGVKKGDEISEINGTKVKGKTTTEVVALIQNDEPQAVKLKLSRKGKELSFEMKKEKIDKSVVTSSMLEDKIGYIQISSFNKLTPVQFREGYDKLNGDGMKALILDLRGNPGGLVSACCDTLRLFMPKGALVYEQDRNGKEKHRDCKGKTPIEIPVAVLVNEKSASAAEMFTGAVQDYKVGYVIGTNTYGKGIEQDSYLLSDGSVVKFTVTRYYTPNHNDVNGTGIVPDKKVKASGNGDEDKQLDAGIAYLKKQM
uniref:S41 family peptidase n=1 Tax=Eubacterium cellulosolvens TaxID=29322 RepID=UPI000684A915|nr:S41 family peptidase [[Eubacterium] cellulosolvens]